MVTPPCFIQFTICVEEVFAVGWTIPASVPNLSFPLVHAYPGVLPKLKFHRLLHGTNALGIGEDAHIVMKSHNLLGWSKGSRSLLDFMDHSIAQATSSLGLCRRRRGGRSALQGSVGRSQFPPTWLEGLGNGGSRLCGRSGAEPAQVRQQCASRSLETKHLNECGLG